MNYNAIVIGAGPAGYVASIRLAQLGLKVALVEKHHFGGECTNYGCIPTKALIESANLFWKAKKGGEIGVFSEPKYDLKAFMVWKDKIVNQLRSGIGFLCERNGVKVFEGEAFLKSEKNVVVKSASDTIEVFAENIVVATVRLQSSYLAYHLMENLCFLQRTCLVWKVYQIVFSLSVVARLE